jgi:homotetrameric cytidine deaminase
MKNMKNTGKSYVPYSKKHRTCYILGHSDTVYPGVRIENISFPITIPAVQAAVCSCLANGDEPKSILIEGEEIGLERYWIDELGLQVHSEKSFNGPIYNPLIPQAPDDVTKSLIELCEMSVVQESKFPVSALLVTSDGWIPGVNVEFKDWNLGLCAERVALSRAISAGITEFDRIHIYAPKSDFCSPCGSCRQVLYELMPDATVELHHDEQSLTNHQVRHLLPYGFTSIALRSS